jgi:hypothetical protein
LTFRDTPVCDVKICPGGKSFDRPEMRVAGAVREIICARISLHSISR